MMAYYYFNQPCREMDAHPIPQGHPITKQGGLWTRYDCHTLHGWL